MAHRRKVSLVRDARNTNASRHSYYVRVHHVPSRHRHWHALFAHCARISNLAARGGCTCIQHEVLVRYQSPQQLEQD